MLHHDEVTISAHGDRVADAGGSSFIRFAAILLRRPRLTVGLPLAFAVLTVVMTAIGGGLRYEASSIIEPQSSEPQVGQIAALAAQFGFQLGGLSNEESLEFYTTLVGSNELLREALLTEYRFSTRDLNEAEGDSLAGTLLEILDIGGDTEEHRIRRGVRRLDSWVRTRADLPSGTVTLETQAPWPELAVKLNRRILTLVNEFNLKKRQSQAGAERRFTETRLAEERDRLTKAEDALANFYNRNRRWASSPELQSEADRLQREVDFRQQVYTTLAQEYERARINEVRNTPVINVIDPPEASVEQAGSYFLYAVLAGMLGFAFAAGLAFVSEHFRRERQIRPGEFAELTQLTRDVPRRLLPKRLPGAFPGRDGTTRYTDPETGGPASS